MQTAMGPGEPVRAKSGKQTLEELGHAGLAPSYCGTHRRAARTVARTDRADYPAGIEFTVSRKD
jgi:hypothetical protein